MKKLLIGLLAFALTLGVSCKKDVGFEPEVKKEILNKKAEGEVKEDAPLNYGPGSSDVVIGTNPFGWPHVHANIPRNSFHNAVVGWINGGLGHICSGNASKYTECTFFENYPRP